MTVSHTSSTSVRMWLDSSTGAPPATASRTHRCNTPSMSGFSTSPAGQLRILDVDVRRCLNLCIHIRSAVRIVRW